MQFCAPRELVLHRTWREEDDGTFVMVATSGEDAPNKACLEGATPRRTDRHPWLRWLYPDYVRAQVCLLSWCQGL